MVVEDVFKVMTNSDRVIIARKQPGSKEEILCNGFLGIIRMDLDAATLNKEVKELRFIPEIYHKRYKELGLLPPMKPEEAADYSFTDLELKLYYKIVI